MRTIRTSKLIEQQKIANSITVSPLTNPLGRFEYYEIEYFLKTRRKKTVFVKKIIEDVEIPQIDNRAVAHFGYGIYKYYLDKGFYINFYQLKEE